MFSKSKTHMLDIHGRFYVFRKNTKVGRLAAQFFFFSHTFSISSQIWAPLYGNRPLCAPGSLLAIYHNCHIFPQKGKAKKMQRKSGMIFQCLFASLSPNQNPRIPEIQCETVICVINKCFY